MVDTVSCSTRLKSQQLHFLSFLSMHCPQADKFQVQSWQGGAVMQKQKQRKKQKTALGEKLGQLVRLKEMIRN